MNASASIFIGCLKHPDVGTDEVTRRQSQFHWAPFLEQIPGCKFLSQVFLNHRERRGLASSFRHFSHISSCSSVLVQYVIASKEFLKALINVLLLAFRYHNLER